MVYNEGMKIIIETNRSNNRAAKKQAEYQRIASLVLQNFEQEINNNPELLETVYATDMAVAMELQSRMEDLLAMSGEADKMAGGWRGKLAYKFSKR